jgi:hypothetical protein
MMYVEMARDVARAIAIMLFATRYYPDAKSVMLQSC